MATDKDPHRRTLRRARDHGIQPGAWRSAGRNGSRLSDTPGSEPRPDPGGESRTRVAILHIGGRIVFGAEPTRPFREHREVAVGTFASHGGRDVRELRGYSTGSTRISEAPRLLPIQNAGGVLPLSTFTRRMFVIRGSRYSTTSPVFVFTRTTRSLFMPPAHAKPVRSAMAS